MRQGQCQIEIGIDWLPVNHWGKGMWSVLMGRMDWQGLTCRLTEQRRAALSLPTSCQTQVKYAYFQIKHLKWIWIKNNVFLQFYEIFSLQVDCSNCMLCFVSPLHFLESKFPLCKTENIFRKKKQTNKRTTTTLGRLLKGSGILDLNPLSSSQQNPPLQSPTTDRGEDDMDVY